MNSSHAAAYFDEITPDLWIHKQSSIDLHVGIFSNYRNNIVNSYGLHSLAFNIKRC